MTYIERKQKRMAALKKISSSVLKISSMPDDFDDDYDDIEDSLEKLRKEVPLGISYRKEPAYILSEDTNVYGAAYVSNIGGVISFDLIIAPSHRGQGWAEKFIDIIINDFKNAFLDDVAESLEVHVVNPILIPLLKKKGFVVVEQIGNEVYMRYENQNSADDSYSDDSWLNY